MEIHKFKRQGGKLDSFTLTDDDQTSLYVTQFCGSIYLEMKDELVEVGFYIPPGRLNEIIGLLKQLKPQA